MKKLILFASILLVGSSMPTFGQSLQQLGREYFRPAVNDNTRRSRRVQRTEQGYVRQEQIRDQRERDRIRVVENSVRTTFQNQRRELQRIEREQQQEIRDRTERFRDDVRDERNRIITRDALERRRQTIVTSNEIRLQNQLAQGQFRAQDNRDRDLIRPALRNSIRQQRPETLGR